MSQREATFDSLPKTTHDFVHSSTTVYLFNARTKHTQHTSSQFPQLQSTLPPNGLAANRQHATATATATAASTLGWCLHSVSNIKVVE